MTAHLNQVAIEPFKLRKVYGHGNTEVVAMNNVSLQVHRGEVAALLGPSGAGKSTLLTALGLINPPTSGRIEIGGTLVLDGDNARVDLRAFRRKHLGFVFQKANLIPFLNAVQNVQLALEINDAEPRHAKKRALELLNYLGVDERALNMPDMLSGGQQHSPGRRLASLCSLPELPNSCVKRSKIQYRAQRAPLRKPFSRRQPRSSVLPYLLSYDTLLEG